MSSTRAVVAEMNAASPEPAVPRLNLSVSHAAVQDAPTGSAAPASEMHLPEKKKIAARSLAFADPEPAVAAAPTTAADHAKIVAAYAAEANPESRQARSLSLLKEALVRTARANEASSASAEPTSEEAAVARRTHIQEF